MATSRLRHVSLECSNNPSACSVTTKKPGLSIKGRATSAHALAAVHVRPCGRGCCWPALQAFAACPTCRPFAAPVISAGQSSHTQSGRPLASQGGLIPISVGIACATQPPVQAAPLRWKPFVQGSLKVQQQAKDARSEARTSRAQKRGT